MEIKESVFKSLIYKLMERFGSFFVTFIIQLILARLLGPSDFGLIAILNVFIVISQVFVQSGLNTALVQKKEVDKLDYSSVFYVSFLLSIILSVCLIGISPFIEDFYSMNGLSSMLRVLSVVIVIGSFNSIQIAMVSRNMWFKFLMISTIISGVISGVVGIILAYAGFGSWALVFQQIINALLNCLILAYRIRWFPEKIFSITRVKVLFSFGSKILLSSLLDTIYTQVQSLIIGRSFSAQTLGYYNRGQQFPQMIISNLNGAIQSVIFPTLSKLQDDVDKSRSVMRRAVVTSCYFVFPVMVGMGVLAKPIVLLLLGKNWLGCVPYLQVSCVMLSLIPIHTANLQAINAKGRSDIMLKLEIIKKVVGVSILIISLVIYKSAMALAVGATISSFLSLFINAAPNKRLLNYDYVHQIKDILPYAISSLVMGMVVFYSTIFFQSEIVKVVIGVFLGVLFYLLFSLIFKLDAFMYLLRYFKIGVKKYGK